jgi:hypothetical protein
MHRSASSSQIGEAGDAISKKVTAATTATLMTHATRLSVTFWPKRPANEMRNAYLSACEQGARPRQISDGREGREDRGENDGTKDESRRVLDPDRFER